ncbi:aromatic-ring-hydroxylating dioxygenase subunit beta [Pigmentiphaga litoralis]|uniref:aromatic-ring-hydroxylating dioxygenase subunit beta n=1 Tax=Pigmentiphaga litoralis TaxID=516702 RepID=UPI003B430461
MERIEAFLYTEAHLLDTQQLDAWLALFAPDGVYWVPIADTPSRTDSASIIYDDAIAREERVHHYLHLSFPAQTPRSRTLHQVSNIRIAGRDADELLVDSNQVIHEVRGGDVTQVGLGQTNALAAAVQFTLRPAGDDYRIVTKKILLLQRNMALGNLTFML